MASARMSNFTWVNPRLCRGLPEFDIYGNILLTAWLLSQTLENLLIKAGQVPVALRGAFNFVERSILLSELMPEMRSKPVTHG